MVDLSIVMLVYQRVFLVSYGFLGPKQQIAVERPASSVPAHHCSVSLNKIISDQCSEELRVAVSS
jgi:hypothetical protein